MAGNVKVYDIRNSSDLSRLHNYATYKPTQVGTFAISEDGDFIDCNTAKIPTMKSFKLPLHLNEGYNPNAVDDSRETNFPQWEKGLKWIHGNDLGYRSISDVDVITQRGVLKEIGYTNHNRFKNPWKFEACKFEGKVYIRKFEEEEEWNAWAVQNSYWGKRFEKYVMEQESGIKATYKILKGNIGEKRILISAEVDSVTAEGEHMELKTCFANKLNDKIPLAWLQSHLGKVDVLYYGLKDRQGIVRKIPTEISMANVPGRYVKAHDANAMISLIGDFIKWLYSALPDMDETWMLEYTGGRQIVLKRCGGKFLPSWYVQFVNDHVKEVELEKQVEALSLSHPSFS
jgi:hypothetical protein